MPVVRVRRKTTTLRLCLQINTYSFLDGFCIGLFRTIWHPFTNVASIRSLSVARWTASLANRHLPQINDELGEPGVFRGRPAEFAIEVYKNKVGEYSRSESNRKAVVNENGQHTPPSRTGILRSRNHSCSIISTLASPISSITPTLRVKVGYRANRARQAWQGY